MGILEYGRVGCPFYGLVYQFGTYNMINIVVFRGVSDNYGRFRFQDDINNFLTYIQINCEIIPFTNVDLAYAQFFTSSLKLR
jgi:hypothetical protein